MALLEIRELSKSYGGIEVLRDISLDVATNDILALIGPTGSGKTTLLRLIDLLEKPTRGSITFHGMDVTRISEKKQSKMRRKMAMVFQKPVMFKSSVYDNVAYGLKIRRDMDLNGKVTRAIRSVGLEGYERRDANTLSGGEMQRIALARALVVDPEILLLDEPTANLDPNSAAAINDLISRLARNGMTIIMATHNMLQCLKLADRAALILNGHLIGVGKPEEVLRLPEFSANICSDDILL